MNREIEFRAWLKDENKMYGVSEIHFSSEGIEYIVCCDLKTYDRPYFYVDLKDIELIEYTGLKDKNGVKIFEGDIVKNIYSNSKYEIFLDEENCCFRMRNIDDDYDYLVLNIREAGMLEVIGNKWENPELIGENYE